MEVAPDGVLEYDLHININAKPKKELKYIEAPIRITASGGTEFNDDENE